jgi:uncharacterized damage-inducible protein DinB
MQTQDLTALFERDLKRLSQEIAAYDPETGLWEVAEGIRNSAGNLCLHLMGNLNFFIGTTLGQTGYVRNREAEFSLKNVPQSQLLQQIDATSRVVDEVIASLTADQLRANYPAEVLGYPMTTLYFLMHLHSHLTYHLGQIDYHRRLLTKGQAIQFVN